MKKKIGAWLLTLMMVATMIPSSAFVSMADVDDAAAKVADNSTINEWEKYFTDPDMGTQYAGGVWTDKSVFKSGEEFDNALNENEAKTNITTEDDNFLVAMSALATNKEVVGYSTIPTDTIFVLDVSGSMDTAESVPDMVSSANKAIDDLLKLNKNNRVGVVLYSGGNQNGAADTGTGTVILGLDRYTANNNGNYIRYQNKNKDDRDDSNDFIKVSTANGLRIENGRFVTSTSKDVRGGTYIQNGIYLAMKEFLKADPTVGNNNVQSGEKRMPIFVLMSDGAPTSATTSYTGNYNGSNKDTCTVGTSNMGTGQAITASAGTGFLTQLTAAYARNITEEHYGREGKFYTLGLNLKFDESEFDESEFKKNEAYVAAIAASVLNPKHSISAINEYWEDLFANGEVTFTAQGTNPVGKLENIEENDVSYTVQRPKINGEYTDHLANAEEQFYVDKYFDAESNEKLSDAFSKIVAEIILQSAYYPTYIETENRDLSGYVSFIDEIGHFMDVKDVKGILLGENMFTGATVAQMMGTGVFGDRNEFTEEGWELVKTVASRIGIEEVDAINLLKNAWADGQLSYDKSTGEYSNYMGWYESASGKYIGNWKQADDEASEQDAVKKGAKYISKSYLYYGANDEDSILGSDMMHVIVKVQTDIATGLQTVVFQVPASLIPIITYDITLDAKSYEEAKKITMELSEKTPIRLLFEVGLNDEINEYNLNEIMSEDGAHSHPVLKDGEPTGEYYFYTNVWGYGNDESQMLPGTHQVAESVFTPSPVNERYYYTEDSIIYIKDGSEYKPYTGTNAPAGSNYYRAYRTFKFTDSSNAAKMEFIYEHIAAETLADSDNIAKNDKNQWYIKAGTVRQSLESYHIEKLPEGTNGGPTETLKYSRYAVIQPSEELADYSVYSFQGNNGRLKMAPATGIKLTKEVDETLKNVEGTYEFEISINSSAAEYNAKLTRGNNTSELQFKNGKATIELEAGETVYITDIPVGEYSVKEIIPSGAGYKVDEISVGKEIIPGQTAEGTIRDKELENITFTNTEAKTGELTVIKNVTNEITSAETAVNNKEFNINVKLTDADGNTFPVGTEFNAEKATGQADTNKESITVTIKDDGSFDTKLKHNEGITIKNLPEGTKYVVTETNLPHGFTLKSENNNLTGSITADKHSTVTVVNDYQPEGVPTNGTIEIELDKSITGREWNNTDEFKFQLEKMNADGGWTPIGGIKTVTNDNKSATFEIANKSMTTTGNHVFRINEINGSSIPGLTSDTAKYFTIVVTDEDGDGYLEIEEIQSQDNSVDVSEANGKYSIDVNFVNTYTTTGNTAVTIPVEKQLTNNTGVVRGLGGYEFALFELTDDTNKPVDVNGDSDGNNIVSSEAGDATIHLTYTAAEFADLDTDNDNNVTLNYILEEVKGDKVNTVYSSQKYKITVTLTSEDGKLSSSVTIVEDKSGAVETNKAVFVNEFKITDNAKATLGLTAEKKLEGRDLKANEFSFNLYETDANFTVKAGTEAKTASNDKNGNISFGTLSYDKAGKYYYVIEEAVPAEKAGGVTYSNEKYHVTVDVTYDDASNKLTAEKSIFKVNKGAADNITFTNKYNASSVNMTIEGTKQLTGKDLNDKEFTFELWEGNDKVSEATNAHIVAVDGVAEGTFKFPEIKYNKPGEHTYIVKEAIPEAAKKDDMTGKYVLNGTYYDDSEYTVTVNVTDDGSGKLNATQAIKKGTDTADEIAFKNEYKPAPETLSFSANKKLENRTLKAGEYSFGIYKADSKFTITDEKPITTAVNDAKGAIKFAPVYVDAAGTYYYVMKEIVPDESDSSYDSDMRYDSTEYHIKAIVYDQGGKLSSNVTYTANGMSAKYMLFSNVYMKPANAELDLDVAKVLKGRDLNEGEFEFELYETDSTYQVTGGAELVQTATNEAAEASEAGAVSFNKLLYDVDDLDGAKSKDFYYVIKEKTKASDTQGIEYDDSCYHVKVTVSNNGNGKLVTEKTIEKLSSTGADAKAETVNSIVFTNNYEAKEATLDLGGNKTLDNKTLNADDFTFNLYKTDNSYNVEDKNPVDTAKNNAKGKFAFEQLSFEETGTFYYVVEESRGEDAGTADGQVDYDSHKYQIKVEVKDNGKGQLELDVTYDENTTLTQKTSAEISDLNFANKYNPTDAKLNLSGKKTLEGRDAKVGEFNFALYETESNYKVAADAKPIQTKYNDENNNIVFDTIVFDTLSTDAEETHYYVVKEIVPENTKGVVYDKTEHHIKAVVKNDGKGALAVSVDGKDYAAAADISNLDFTNEYKSVRPDGESFVIKGQKNLFGDRTEVKKGEFKFVLSEVIGSGAGETVTVIDKAKNAADGSFGFDMSKLAGKYTEPGEYCYRVTEEAGNEKGMTYDDTVYDIKVTVKDDGEGKLLIDSIEYTANGDAADDIEFNNNYVDPDSMIPAGNDETKSNETKTGDSSNMLPFATVATAALAGIIALLLRRKRV